jgi:hypothetical protein
MLGAVPLIARRRDDGPARGAHLAAGSSAGLIALPSLALCALGGPPGPRWLLAATLALLVFGLVRAARADGPSGGLLRQLRAAGLALGLGTLGLVAVSALLAALGRVGYEATPERVAAIFDLDASVATRAIPRCASEPARIQVLLERGARPRFGAGGSVLWFDAAVKGRRQVHRMDPSSGRAVCWTCEEPGNNQRPGPADRSDGVAFETDRHQGPWNSEIHVIDGRGEAPRTASKRLTFSPGPDDHGVLRHGALIWSRRENGSYAVVSAPLRRGHGSLSLGGVSVLTAAGGEWTAPLEWSADARSLVVASGNPFRPRQVRRIDPATGNVTALGDDVAPGGVSFNADGGWVVVASTRRSRVAGLLPERLGFLLAPLAASVERGDPLLRETGLRMGEPWGVGAPIELGEAAGWGAPTGVALAPDASHLVLGQRDAEGQERLLTIALDCR